jgi:hypothetical protein
MPFTHPPALRAAAVERVAAGVRPAQVAEQLATSVTTVYNWLARDAPELVRRVSPCCRCDVPARPPADPAAYAQLLGLYLGDGCLSAAKSTWSFRIACDDHWPGIADEAAALMRALGAKTVNRVPQQGCHQVQSYSRHWLCLFPQHGPGKKHNRPIVFEPWQQQIVQDNPGRLLRGLFHSDGWRGHNVAVHRAPDGYVTRYRYSRYEFTNKSADIRGICTDALDLLGIAWRPNGPWRISVNRRAAVAALDEHVGPKF